MKPSKVVIFISNPFGFGPTGKTVAIIEELNKLWKGKIVYAASSMCLETLPDYINRKIKIENIDERDEKSLRFVFNKYDNPTIVCTLNRLAIKTAKAMGLKAIFIDSLAWMWKEIPKEYLLADTYYCFNLFDINNKIPKKDNIKIISPVFGILPKHKINKSPFILFHIGGFKNPFQDKMSFAYLNLLIDSFQNYKLNKKIIVTGGKDAISYISNQVSSNNFSFQTLGRDEFLQHLNKASHFVTTPGLTATLEAFALRTPTSFLPPTNLSQWNILKLLTKINCANSSVNWANVTKSNINLEGLSEIEAVPIFNQISKDVLGNKTSRNNFVSRINSLLTSIPDNKNQTEFITISGTNGSEVIVQDLITMLSTQ